MEGPTKLGSHQQLPTSTGSAKQQGATSDDGECPNNTAEDGAQTRAIPMMGNHWATRGGTSNKGEALPTTGRHQQQGGTTRDNGGPTDGREAVVMTGEDH